MNRLRGFTLIEVLLALAIIAIALAALFKGISENISHTQRLKDKTISHWVAMQGVTMIQLGLIKPDPRQEITEVTTLFNQKWYWRVKVRPTPVQKMQEITITVSQNQSGPFMNPLIAFRYLK